MTHEPLVLRHEVSRLRGEFDEWQRAAAVANVRLRRQSRVAWTCLVVFAGCTVAAQVPSKIPSTTEEQIFALLKRVTGLEERLARPLTVRAPFEVQDRTGAPLMVVDTGSISFWDGAPSPKLQLGAVAGNGTIRVFGDGSTTEISNGQVEITHAASTMRLRVDRIEINGALGGELVAGVRNGRSQLYLEAGNDKAAVSPDGGLEIQNDSAKLSAKPQGITLLDDGTPRAFLGEGEKKNMALRIFNDGVQVAGIGIDPEHANGGAVKIGDPAGTIVASMTSLAKGEGSVAVFGPSGKSVASLGIQDNGRGFVAVWNAAGVAVSALNENSAGGGGNITTTDPAGNGIFSAGWIGSGGAACVNRSETKGLWCLGTNIPLGIGANPKR